MTKYKGKLYLIPAPLGDNPVEEVIPAHVLNEHTGQDDIRALLELFADADVGLMSEAGLPAVADPGARLVELCHENDIDVVPMVGPSSLMMALMGSGLNGQCFEFCGYIPAKPEQRRQALKTLEKQSRAAHRSEIIIETPYRNDSMLADMLEVLSPDTRICIAADISLETQFIRTRKVSEWCKSPMTVGKRPCVFIILA